MSKTSIPKNYHDLLGLYDTQRAIGIIKTIFQEKLCAALHLKRVTAPLFVLNGSGLNDDLNGVERPVSFDVPCLDEPALKLCTAWPNGSAMPLLSMGSAPARAL